MTATDTKNIPRGVSTLSDDDENEECHTTPTTGASSKKQHIVDDSLQNPNNNHIPAEEASSMHILTFEDFADFSSRCVLFPRVEEEGIGAIIGSYAPIEKIKDTKEDNKDQEAVAALEKERRQDDKEGSSSSSSASFSSDDYSSTCSAEEHSSSSSSTENASHHTSQYSEADTSGYKRNYSSTFSEEHSSSSSWTENASHHTSKYTEADASDENENDFEPSPMSLEGAVLVGLVEEPDTKESWRVEEFTTILAMIRQADSPIELIVELKPEDADSESNPEEARQSSSPIGAEDEKPPSLSSPIPNIDTKQLFNWGNRIRQQSGQYAQQAAQVVAKTAAEAKERAKKLQQEREQAALLQQKMQNQQSLPATTGGNSNNSNPLRVFVQSSAGAFIPVSDLCSSPNNDTKISTSSLLVVRSSASEPCPAQGVSMQWYRSGASRSLPTAPNGDDDVSTLASHDHPYQMNEEEQWTRIEGATSPAFQPDATLVGRRLQCRINMDIPSSETNESSAQDESIDVDDLGSVAPEQVCIIETVSQLIMADSNLMNGSRQALVRGAQFANLEGVGKASGRTFRVTVSLKASPSNRRRATSSLLIAQAVGTSNEPMHSSIASCSVVVDASHPKQLAIVFPPESIGPETMLSALLTEEGTLPLQFPNRMTRESFILALGIANFRGSPADLKLTTILFPDDPFLSSDSTVGSASSSLGSSGNHSQVSSICSGRSRSESIGSTRGLPPLPPTSPVHIVTSTVSTAVLPSRINSSGSSNGTEPPSTKELQDEISFLRAKLARKDKVVSELQRKITENDSVTEQSRTALEEAQLELQDRSHQQSETAAQLRQSQAELSQNQATITRLQNEHAQKVQSLEAKIDEQERLLADAKKSQKTLQNEKAVLQAAVEARDQKLEKIAATQTNYEQLEQRLSENNALEKQLEDSRIENLKLQGEIDALKEGDLLREQEMLVQDEAMAILQTKLDQEQKKAKATELRLSELQKANQALKSERNNFKQKNESLFKELNRLCRHGHSFQDLDRMIGDYQTLKEEVKLLRKHKREAVEEAKTYRNSYEQMKDAQLAAGVDLDMIRALERNSELERMLTEMTEFVQAKELQMDTLKQINEALQDEIHGLAKINLRNNEV